MAKEYEGQQQGREGLPTEPDRCRDALELTSFCSEVASGQGPSAWLHVKAPSGPVDGENALELALPQRHGLPGRLDHDAAFEQVGGEGYAQDRASFQSGRPTKEPQRRRDSKDEKASAAKWTATWLEIGKANPWIGRALDPPFTFQSFHPCLGAIELIDHFQRDGWCLGQAFTLGDLCFINQTAGTNEWLVIKEATPFDSMALGWIIKTQGRAAALDIVERMRAASLEQCKDLEY